MEQKMTRTECLYHLKMWYGKNYSTAVRAVEEPSSAEEWEDYMRDLASPTFEEFADSKSLALTAFYRLSELKNSRS